ncbi:KinB-signaling pathway activation protein [Rubeoparvulum massiliense]|uniref:KinB-signaling pathway activation protein n=1 Tax=Rubeoparvulum massiliense TaxID=1631346 RepID=UPI00065E26D7|nr:KinB-signaling pathway activation protein [Rubeoparvulum massiliense]
MTLRKWFSFYLSTLLVGALASFVTGALLLWRDTNVFQTGGVDLAYGLFTFTYMGLIYATLSHMGFFAYLTVHYFAIGLFRSIKLLAGVQVVIILFTIFDLIYFRMTIFSFSFEETLPLVIALLFFGLIIAYLKTRETNMANFFSTLFVMVVITAVELVPAMQIAPTQQGVVTQSVVAMLIPLLATNAWQVMRLHRILPRKSHEEQPPVQMIKQS